jgi:hypothetical protein
MQKFCLFLLFALAISWAENASGQTMKISGEVSDTTNFKPLRDASVVIIRLSDSLIIDYTRTDMYGKFSFENLPLDTVEVLITHPRFSDLSYYVVGSPQNNDVHIDNIIMSENIKAMNEVVIFASQEPVYYRGDTLVFVADSFDVKTNAVVEDLLKKLPGVEVDGNGGIQFQGKEVVKVLVDGDEFFGSDHLIATRNLDARAIENVEIYETERENAQDGSTETVQVMNLKLKEEAKKGYFGRVAAGGDFQRFYEGEVLASTFNSKRKISVYFQSTNTPNSGFSWQDSQQYGIENERQAIIDEDGDWIWFGSPSREGLPQTTRAGFVYQDQLSKKLSVGLTYSFKDARLEANSDLSRQFFFADSSYAIVDANKGNNRNVNHAINLNLDFALDSNTVLSIRPQFKMSTMEQRANNVSTFLNNTRDPFSESYMNNENQAEEMSFSNLIKFEHKFKKRNQKFELTYQIDYQNNNSFGKINNRNILLSDSSEFSVFDQQKRGALNGVGHLARGVYWQPITKFTRLELEYQFNFFETTNGVQTFNQDGNGIYTNIDSTFSNSFENRQMINFVGLFGRIEKGKHMIRAGARLRNNQTSNLNLFTQDVFNQNVNNILPSVTYRFKPKQSAQLRVGYSTDARLPSIGQLQPLLDNTNPNQIFIGNANLVPSYSHDINVNYNTWNGIKSHWIWGGIYGSQTNNAFSNSITFNPNGQTVSETINVNGNYSFGAYSGAGKRYFDDLFTLNIDINTDYRNNNNIINGDENTTKNLSAGGGLNTMFDNDTLLVSLGFNTNYNKPRSTLGLGSNQPFWQHTFDVEFGWEVIKRLRFETDATYNILTQRADGFNLNYVIINASLNYRFLKNENLVLSLQANDILNQNTTVSRNITTNMIMDSRTQIINRYFMLKLTWNFKNRLKEKEADETFE